MSGGVDIVIVNWNSGQFLGEAIDSLLRECSDLVSVLVIVDNGSNDESLRAARHVSASGSVSVVLLENGANRGFAMACNQGAAAGTASSILFLNPDATVTRESLEAPLAFLRKRENEKIGIVGVQLVDELGHVARSCARFPSAKTFLLQAVGLSRLPWLRRFSQAMAEWDHLSTRQVDQVIGAFFLVRRSVFEQLGGFDERFFVYFEEVDFSLRAKNAGWSTVYLADTAAFHAGGGTSRQVKAHRLFYSLRSRLLFSFKHFSFGAALLTAVVTLLIEPVTRSFHALATGSGVSATLKGYAMLYWHLPSILRRGLQE